MDIQVPTTTRIKGGVKVPSVASLKFAIERRTKAPPNSLVLLISGGEVLQSDHMVSSYSAGTDSNPIFMFVKPSFSCDTRSVFDGKSVSELRAAVDKCCSMTPNVHTVIACATLAQQFSDLALELNAQAHRFSGFDVFEETDFEGHPYRVSHPLDSSSEKPCQDFSGVEAFKLSEEDVFEHTKDATSSKESAHSSEALQRIYDTNEGVTFRARTSSCQSHEEHTLLHWILAQGNKASLQDILDYCQKGLALVTFRARTSSCQSHEEHTLLHWILAQGNKASLQDILDYCQKGLALSAHVVLPEPRGTHAAALDPRAGEQGLAAGHTGLLLEGICAGKEGVTFRARTSSCQSHEEHTLLHWILAQGNKASLQDILDYCQKGLAL
ncbi:putative rb1-inducible coiled-coil 1, partial [Operophtera brumata]